MNSMTELTKIQHCVVEFVRAELNVGRSARSSQNTTQCHRQAISRKGWLVADAGKARSLRLAAWLKPAVHTVVEIPFLGSIPAGFSDARMAVTGKCVPLPLESVEFKTTQNSFALRVTGDSMIGRHICDGDIVLLEYGPEPRSGQIVAALIDGEVTLKTFVSKNGRTFLKAENPKYPDLYPAEDLVIQGVLQAIVRRGKE
jgi:repressor LexA